MSQPSALVQCVTALLALIRMVNRIRSPANGNGFQTELHDYFPPAELDSGSLSMTHPFGGIGPDHCAVHETFLDS